jgi:hypothetical protein
MGEALRATISMILANKIGIETPLGRGSDIDSRIRGVSL